MPQAQTAANVARQYGVSITDLGDESKNTVRPSASGVSLLTIVDSKRIDFRAADVCKALDALLDRLASPQRAVAVTVLSVALATGVYPSRVTLARDGDLFFYFFPGGQAPRALDRAHALITIYEDGGMVALVSDRTTDASKAWEFGSTDLNATLNRVRTFLRDGSTG